MGKPRIYAEGGAASWIMDAETNSVLSEFSHFDSWGPAAYDQSNHELYLCSFDNRSVTAYSEPTGGVVAGFSFPKGPCPVAYDPKNGDIYVDIFGGDGVSVIDGSTDRVIKNFTVGDQYYSAPNAIVYDAVNGYIYEGDWNMGTVSVIDGSKNAVIKNIVLPCGTSSPKAGVLYCGVDALVVDPTNGDVYALDWNVPNLPCCDTLSLIRGTSLVDTIKVDPEPAGMAFDGSGHAYVSSKYSGTVSVLDTANSTIVSKVAVGTHPTTVVYDPDNQAVYVANHGSDFLSMITAGPHPEACSLQGVLVACRLSDAGMIQVGEGQYDLMLDPVNHDLYVGGASLLVVDTCASSVVESGPGAVYYFVSVPGVYQAQPYPCGGAGSQNSTTTSEAAATLAGRLPLEMLGRSLPTASSQNQTSTSTTSKASGAAPAWASALGGGAAVVLLGAAVMVSRSGLAPKVKAVAVAAMVAGAGGAAYVGLTYSSGGPTTTQGPALQLANQATAMGVDNSSAAPVGLTSEFHVNDSRAYSWVEFANLTSSHTVKWVWLSPQGHTANTSTLAIPDPGQGHSYASYAVWDHLSISRHTPSVLPGKWQVAVYLDGTKVLTQRFTISDNGTTQGQRLEGFSWPTTVIPVYVQGSPASAYHAVVAAMRQWNDSQAWFQQAFDFPSQPVYELVLSNDSSSPVQVEFNQTQTNQYLETAHYHYNYDSGGTFTSVTCSMSIDLQSTNGVARNETGLENEALSGFGYCLGLGHASPAADLMNAYSGETVDLKTPSTLNLFALYQLYSLTEYGAVPDVMTLSSGIGFGTSPAY